MRARSAASRMLGGVGSSRSRDLPCVRSEFNQSPAKVFFYGIQVRVKESLGEGFLAVP